VVEEFDATPHDSVAHLVVFNKEAPTYLMKETCFTGLSEIKLT
jgi:hypothetical protein